MAEAPTQRHGDAARTLRRVRTAPWGVSIHPPAAGTRPAGWAPAAGTRPAGWAPAAGTRPAGRAPTAGTRPVDWAPAAGVLGGRWFRDAYRCAMRSGAS